MKPLIRVLFQLLWKGDTTTPTLSNFPMGEMIIMINDMFVLLHLPIVGYFCSYVTLDFTSDDFLANFGIIDHLIINVTLTSHPSTCVVRYMLSHPYIFLDTNEDRPINMVSERVKVPLCFRSFFCSDFWVFSLISFCVIRDGN